MLTKLRPALKAFLFSLFSFVFIGQTKAQCPACTATTYNVNLSAVTDTAWTTTGTRNGNCCTGTNCVRFNVTLNPASDLLNFDVTNPSPSGSAFYQINCGPQISIGTQACIIGLTTVCITYCKPGGDSPIYHITATRTVHGSNDVTVRAGCSATLSVTGLVPSSILWTSINPAPQGAYNSYLSCTSACTSTIVTPTSAVPAFVDYMVSGNPTTSCPGTSRDTIRVFVVPAMSVNITPTNGVLCSAGPGSVTLTANVSGGAVPYTYLWSPGGQTTPSISVSSAGTYTVSVGDATSGCPPITATVTVTAAPTPPAPTTSSNSPVCAGSPINLTASPIAGATYAWTGPNAFSSATQNPTIASAIPANAGTYSVTATAAGCTGPAGTTTVVVNPIPGPPVAGSNSPVCSTSTLNLTASNVAGATYTWTGPNGFSSATQNPSILNVTAAAAGTYSVTVTVGGCTSSFATTAVTINPTPAAPTASSNSPICAGSALNLTASNIAGATYAWTGPNGFSSATQNPSIAGATTAATGTYSVTATVGGCTSLAGTVAVTVNPIPAAPTASSNSPICAGSALNLTASNIAGATYAWTGPNGFSSATQNPSIAGATTAATGTYSVMATVGGCTSLAGTVAVTVNPIPAAPTASSNSPICAGSALNLTASNIAGATYAWTGPNAFSSAVQNPSIAGATTAATGTYSVTATVAGCTGPAGTVAVTVNPIPAAPTASSNSPICAGSTLNLTASNIAGATYAWTGPNTFSSATQNPSIAGATIAATGTYSVTATVAGCTGPAGTVAVTVNPIPATPSPSSNSPVCAGQTLNLTTGVVAGASYSWTGPNAFSSAVQNPSIAGATVAASGTYTLTVTVAGCTSAQGTTNVTVNPIPAAPTASSNSPICAGTTLNLTASNIAGASYSWTGPNTFSSATQNPSIAGATTAATGTYSVTATVAGCTGPAGTVAVTVNPIPAAPTASSNSPICAGSTLNLTANNIAGATYAWTGPNAFSSATQNPSIAGATTAATGTYSVTATVAGCTGPAGTVAVTVNPIPAAPTASSNSPICAGSTLNLTASNIAGATYAWTGPNAFSSATQNPSLAGAPTAATGTYSVTATVAGCTGPAGTVAVTVSPIPAAPTASSNSPICAGSTLNLTASNIAGATYAWTGPNTFSSATQNPSIAGATTAATGTYSVTATVAGCTGPAGTVAVIVNPIPAAPTASSNSPICAGSTLNLTASNIAGATYAWTGPNTFSSATQNPSLAGATIAATGTYSVTATVAGCTGPAGTVAVTVNPIPAAPTASSNSPICAGSTLNLTASNIAGATYAWTGPNTFSSATQNPSIAGATTAATGTYSVTATVAGCTGPAGTVAVTVNPIPAAPSPSSNSPICSGQTLSLTTGAVAGATYLWSGPLAFSSALQNPNIINASVGRSGTYTLTVTVAGCTSAQGTTIVTVNPTPAAPTASSNSPICAGSTLNLTASNIAGVTYAWTGPNGFSSASQNPSIAGATTAASGTYSVNATSAAGCTGANGITVVTVNPIPVAPTASSNSPICAGSTLNLTANNIAGATYAWTGPNSFSSATQNPSIVGATTAATGTYSVTVTVAGCTGPAGTVSVTVNPIPAPPAASSNSPICDGSTLNLSAGNIAGATYSWSGPNLFFSTSQNPTIANATTAATGTYSVTVTVAGCNSAAATTVVTVNPIPATPTASSNSPICVGQTLNLTTGAVAGATYSWTGPNGFSSASQNPVLPGATVAATGTYSLTTTVNGCTSSTGTVNVIVNTPPATPTVSSNSPVCTGTTLNLTSSLVVGATYSWTGPNGFSSALQNPNIVNVTLAAAGTYTLVVNNGCASTPANVTVVVNATPAAPTASSNSPICDGSTLNLTASNIAGVTYSWTGPNGFSSSSQNPSIAGATTAASGTYSVTATSAAGCTGNAGTTNVTVNPIPATPSPSSNSPVCSGTTLSLTTGAVAGATYSWTGPNGFTSSLQNPNIANATLAAGGTYSLTITVLGCGSSSGTVTVVVNATPAAPTASSNSPICDGSTLNLNTNNIPGATYSWTGPNGFTDSNQNPVLPNATTAATGTYSVTITVNGCTGPAGTTAVLVNPIPATPSPSSNSPVCVGQTLSFTTSAVAGATYGWTGPNGFSSAVQNPSIPGATIAATGTYSLIVTVNGCSSAAGTVNATVNATPSTPVASSNSPVCSGSVLQLFADTIPGATWSWTGPNGFTSTQQDPTISNVTLAASGTYTVTANNGCASVPTTVTVVVNPTPATPAPNNNGPLCIGSTLNLTTSNVAGATYIWSGPNGFSAATQNTSIPNVTPAEAGTYSVTVTVNGCTSAAGSTTVIINTPAIVNAGPDQTVCANNAAVLLNATSSTGAGVWSTSGNGTFSPLNTALNATYNPGTADTAAGIVTLTFTSSNNGACSPVNDQVVITITDAPTVNAGADQTVCANNSTVTLSGSFTTSSGALWSTSGSGTFAPSASAMNATYSPAAADTVAGTVTIYLTSTGNGTCFAVSDSMIITITPAPVANAGNNTSVCINNPNVSLSGTSSTGTGTWSTSGAGSFNPNPNALNATYIPGAADLAAGSILIFLNTTNNGNCISVQDTLVVIFSQPPVVNAGNDTTTCANNGAVSLNGTSSTGSGTWTTSGSGTFSPNANLLNATYTPDAADTAAGSVTLTLTTTNNGGCIAVTDQLVLTITDAPVANAGPDQSICSNNASAALNGSVGVATGGTWTTSGSGIFSPSANAVNATYTASAADTAAGTIFLVLTTTGNGLCNSVSDTMTLTIFDAPIVNAGPDIISCINNPNTPLNGNSSTGSGSWTTSGTGTFSPNANTLNATYIPSTADTTAGNVTLILTSTGNGSCLAVTDTMNIQFAPVPVITTGPDQTVCANNSAILLTATSSTGSGIWTTSGSGTFSPTATTLNAIYSPSTADTAAGNIVLTFTATNACTPISQNVSITITPAPFVNAGPDLFTCANNPDANFNATIGGGSSTGSWTTSGSGTFSPSTSSLSGTYSPGASDILSGSVLLILTSSNNGNCLAVSDTVVLTITFPPAADAGPDMIACANNAAQLNGGITGGSGTGIWTTPNGSGTFSPSNTALNANYTPVNADTAVGMVMLILTSTNNGGCFADADTMFIQVNPGPVVSAGADVMACSNNANVSLNGSVTIATGGVWATSGNGIFTPDSITMNATYIPDTSDISGGSVTLYLTSTGNGLCSSVTDSMVVNFTPSPMVSAGSSQIICTGTASIPLNGNVTGGASTGQWSTGGDGTFSPNDSTLNASYILGTADTAAGSVTLYLTSTNNGNCFAEADSITITITPVPFAIAGNDTAVCTNTAVVLNGQINGGTGTGYWTTLGDGAFSPDSSALNATYIPGSADTSAGSVTLILNATNACLPSADTVIIAFAPAPLVAAGPDALICAGDIVALNGNVSNSSGVLWSTNGDGMFTPSDTVANPVYIPGPADTAAGNVTLTITSTGNAFCNPASDSLLISINSKPVAMFASGPACMNASVPFTDQSTNANGNIVSWSWTSGADTSTQQNPGFVFSTTGIHSVTLVVATAAGCSDTVVKTINVNPLPQVNFTSVITCPADVVLTDSSFVSPGTIISWNWDFGDTTTSALQNPSHTYADTGAYVVTLTVTSDSSCVAAYSDTLIFIPCANTEVNPPAVPSAFTPNGDGHNDILYVKGGPLTQLDFRIYNEWGNLIFESESQSIGWDGTYKSKTQPEGTYVWTITATTADGLDVKGTGSVTIIR